MNKKIFFEKCNVNSLPLYNLGKKQNYLYYSYLKNLIMRADNSLSTTNVFWSDPMYFDEASKVVNTLHKTNYNLTYCAYNIDSKNKVCIAAFAYNSDYLYHANCKDKPVWFTKE